MYEDCLDHYSWLPQPRRRGCMPRPDPPIVLITGMLEAGAIGGFWVVPGVRHARARRRDPRFCTGCGYPRVGLAEGAVFPECGRGA